MPTLTPTEATVLALAARPYAYEANREAAVRAELGMSLAQFWQAVNALLDSEAALAADPLLVRRLRAVRASRLRVRSA